ncbi:MAG: hypothetical protein M1824_002727 [Vezdaea acicularis]|nr:MAG: hypothetical protein M1824_002727 [Vezdaea acicularis]
MSKSKKSAAERNNPYPASAHLYNHDEDLTSKGPLSFASPPEQRSSYSVNERESARSSTDGLGPRELSAKSAAPTVSTNPDTIPTGTPTSIKASSGGDASGTLGGGMSTHCGGGAGSTFSSPAPSVRSLTTTLTTIQSTAPAGILGPGTIQQNGAVVHSAQTGPSHYQQYINQFPSSPPSASAIPSHLAPQHLPGGNPTTYSSAIANNLLTDNASILTLASSSKRRRRHSLDTDASVRALAPSSVWGGSRESLPLSVLSSNIDNPVPTASGMHQGRPSVGGMTGNERASVYSTAGIAPALTSERSSYYAGKATTTGGDGASMHSGFLGHSRNDSVPGSAGATNSPLASPREVSMKEQHTGKMSRRSSGWGDVGEEESEDEVAEENKGRSKRGPE